MDETGITAGRSHFRRPPRHGPQGCRGHRRNRNGGGRTRLRRSRGMPGPAVTLCTPFPLPGANENRSPAGDLPENSVFPGQRRQCHSPCGTAIPPEKPRQAVRSGAAPRQHHHRHHGGLPRFRRHGPPRCGSSGRGYGRRPGQFLAGAGFAGGGSDGVPLSPPVVRPSKKSPTACTFFFIHGFA